MGRGPLTWILGIVVGVVVVLGVTALIGREDDSGEPVPAGVWAQNVCGAVGVWRGELESHRRRHPNSERRRHGR